MVNETKSDCEQSARPTGRRLDDSPADSQDSRDGRGGMREQQALDRIERRTERQVDGREGRVASKIHAFVIQMPLHDFVGSKRNPRGHPSCSTPTSSEPAIRFVRFLAVSNDRR